MSGKKNKRARTVNARAWVRIAVHSATLVIRVIEFFTALFGG